VALVFAGKKKTFQHKFTGRDVEEIIKMPFTSKKSILVYTNF